MIPLSYFLIAWFVFLAIYAIMALISMLQLIRLGIAGAGTFLSTAAFLVVVIVTVLGVTGYFLTVHWGQDVNLFGWATTSPYINP